MNKQDLIDKLYLAIYEAFNSGHPAYSLTSLPNCYYNSYNEIVKIGNGVIKKLMINDKSKDELDKMVTDDYYIFKFNELYIIINYSCDLYNSIEYKLFIVKERNEALIYRYGQ